MVMELMKYRRLTRRGWDGYIYILATSSTNTGFIKSSSSGLALRSLEKPASRFVRESQEAWRGGFQLPTRPQKELPASGAHRLNMPHYTIGEAVLIG